MTNLKENEITKAILKELKEMGIFCWKHWSGAFSKKGISDILRVLPGGRALAIEVKTNSGKLTGHQWEFLEAVNNAGGVAFMARSVDEVKAELEKIGIRSSQRDLFEKGLQSTVHPP
jgi:hypothetical protein